MNLYQRKTLLIIIAINAIFGLQQYLINETVVFPSPINSFVFFIATVFFLFKSLFNSTRTEKILMFLFTISALIQLVSDTFFLEILLSGQHATVSDWMNSTFFDTLQLIGVATLLITIPIIAKNIKEVKTIYAGILTLFFFALGALAFINISVEPLVILGIFTAFLIYLLVRYKEQIHAGVGAAMYLWVIFFFHEIFEYWNLLL